MTLAELSDFRLVGGTALSLLRGHRESVYQKKYPWFEINDVIKGLSDFTIAEKMPDPICYKKKNWEAIKAEILAEADKIAL